MASLRFVPVLALSLIACAADPADDPTNAGGGGKADGTCESAAYLRWLGDAYLPVLAQLGKAPTAEALASALTASEDMPCTTGSDQDYVAWHQQWTGAWSPILERYNTVFARPATTLTSQARYDEALATATPTEGERRLMQAYLAAKPDRTGPGGYKTWLDGYAPLFGDAFTGKVTTALIFEKNAVVNSAEAILLTIAESARPDTSVERGYAVWFEAYLPSFETAFGPLADASYVTYAERFLESRPASAGDIDYLTFFQTFYTDEERIYAAASVPDARLLARLDALATAAPGDAGGTRSFKPWFNVFRARLVEVLGSDLVVTVPETARIERLLTVKPCSTNPADAPLYAELEALRTKLGPVGGAFSDRAKPATCD